MAAASDPPVLFPRGAMLLSSSVLTPEAEMQRVSAAPEETTLPVLMAETTALPPRVQATILIVEDERIVGLHLRQQLVKLGYKVTAVVSSGNDALKALTDRETDLVLMDIHIEGGMDGIETAGQIRADYALPVIYLTAFSGETTLDRARMTKPYGFMIKPFSERELHASIQIALERWREDQDARDREDRLLIALGLANGNRTWC
jgi:CheY-like chemotaxis protein